MDSKLAPVATAQTQHKGSLAVCLVKLMFDVQRLVMSPSSAQHHSQAQRQQDQPICQYKKMSCLTD